MGLVRICRSADLFPFIEFYKGKGVPVSKYLERFKLPVTIADDEQHYVPLMNACEALRTISHKEGVADLGARTTINKQLVEFGSDIHSCVIQSSTLQIALSRIKKFLESETFVTNLSWQVLGEKCHVLAFDLANRYDTNAWMELMCILSVVRSVVGSTWLPDIVYLPTKLPPSEFTANFFPNSQFVYSPNSVGFVFPVSFLAKKPKQAKQRTAQLNQNVMANSNNRGLNPIDYVQTIKGLIRSYSQNQVLSIDCIAELLSESPRSVQRHLNNENVSYKELLDEIQFENASILLRTNEFKVEQIAFKMGFSDSSHFIRSFKRISGMTPRVYRRLQMGSLAVRN